MILRLLFLLLIGYLAWRLWRGRQLSHLGRPPLPPPGFTPDTDPMVRCEKCGIRLPSSQVAAVRANCKQCNPE